MNDEFNKSGSDNVGADNEDIFRKKRIAAENNVRRPIRPVQQGSTQGATPPRPTAPRPAAPAARPTRQPASPRPVGQNAPAQGVRRPVGTPATAVPQPPQRAARPAVQRPAPAAPAAQVRPTAPSAGQRPVAQNPNVAPRPAAQRPASQRPAVQSGAPSTAARPGEVTPKATPSNAPDAVKAPAKVPAYATRRAAQNAPSPEVTAAPTQLQPAPTGALTETSSASLTDGKKKGKKAKTSNTKAGADMMVSIVKAIIYMVIVLVVSVFISIFVIRIGNDVFAFVKSDEAIEVTIPEGATTADIADILSENGVINYPSVFKMYASLKHESGDYIAGDYTVSPSMSYDQLRGEFKEHIATGTVWITIPEGFTTDEIIDLMVENGIGERDKYIDVINNYDFDYWFIDELENGNTRPGRCYRLEGYLFPDTYEFYNSSSEEMVIKRMLDRFDEVFVEDYKTKAKELGYTVDDIVTLASLIEKEAAGTSDYMYVSSVFNNRLNNPSYMPRLESDATIVYAIQLATGVRPKEVTPADLSFDSPYNTYTHDGLTPGPIANPSASAIRYALYPTKTDYYYFVSANNGTTFYSTTKAEHDANVQKVKAMNEEQN